MNILLWAPFGAGEHYWGPGTSAYRMYRHGLPAGVTVTLAHGFPMQSPYPETFAAQHLVADLGSASYWNQVRFLRKARLWIRDNYSRFDVVHALGLQELTFRPAIWFESLGVPVVLKITGANNLVSHSRFSRYLGIVRNRDRKMHALSGFIAISSDIYSGLLAKGVPESKIFSIPNGVDVNRFAPVSPQERSAARQQLGLRDVFTVLFVGGISRRKNPHLVVQAIARTVHQSGRRVQLLIVGPDRSRDGYGRELVHLIRQEGLEDECLLMGETATPERYYRAADVFVLPSASEGMSNALLEALASGLPSIVTPISGSRELVEHGSNGFHVSPDSNEIAECIEWYLDNPDQHALHARRARDVILEGYSTEAVLSEHLSLFRTLCMRRGIAGSRPM